MTRVVLLALAAALVLAAPARGQATVTMSGSVVTRALVADLAYFYRHEVPDPPRFQLAGGVSATGIADVVNRVSNGGMIARSLTPQDPPGLVFTRIARSGMCLVTNRANPVAGVTRAQVQDIVAGRVTVWSQVPGSSRTDAIVPAGRDPTTGSAQVFASEFVDLATPSVYRPVTLPTDLALRDFIARTPAAFGYLDLALTGPLHVLAIDGVACTRTTVRAGTYPASRPLGVVTRGRPRGAIARFLRWVRTSRTARRVIATRYLPG
jgi:phosphate transport system substrate-binding protein